MKFRLNKLMAGLVMAGGALALVGCGGGDAPTLGGANNVTAAIKKDDAKAIAIAQATVKAFGEAGANFPLSTAVVFDANVTNPGAGVPSIPAGSTLNMNPTTVSGAIADFKIKAGGSETRTVEGYVRPGSCEFVVTGPDNPADMLPGYADNGVYRIQGCSFTLPTASQGVGSQANVTPTLTLNNLTIPAGQTITVTIQDDGSVTAVVNGTTVTLAPAGSVSLTTGGST